MSPRLSVVALLGGALVSTAVAGPLNPPAGPIAPTPAQEPRIPINAANTPGDADSTFKITQPGSYYLTGNLTGVSGKKGIEIASNNVTIDLMGFTLEGVAGALEGINIETFLVTSVVVRNGTVTGWPGDGIDMASGEGSLIENIVSSSNGGRGIRSNVGGIVRMCTANSNGGAGIELFGNGVAVDCSARLNGGQGFTSGFGCTFASCSARENASHGFQVDNGGAVQACASFDNLASGFNCLNNVAISACSARSNSQHGIQVASGCLVRANVCASNGIGGDGAGIRTNGTDNRLEGNHCVGNDQGFLISGAGNLIIQNSSANNSVVNWDITANNVVGPILDRRAPASAAISGNSAPDSTGSTHPNANFTF